jgi:D-alanyl-D-alanine carboxypeptidase/D-alanyl-D-alanine-endopeptidase (penicillin-binding protein 4)
MIINDGSGLSRANAISARHFCDLLRYMYTSPNYLNFRATLPIAGVSGTIKSLCKGQLGEGRVMAKSGTLNNVKGYAGYVETISGKKIAFSFCVNDFSCTSSQLVSKMEAVLNALAEY